MDIEDVDGAAVALPSWKQIDDAIARLGNIRMDRALVADELAGLDADELQNIPIYKPGTASPDTHCTITVLRAAPAPIVATHPIDEALARRSRHGTPPAATPSRAIARTITVAGTAVVAGAAMFGISNGLAAAVVGSTAALAGFLSGAPDVAMRTRASEDFRPYRDRDASWAEALFADALEDCMVGHYDSAARIWTRLDRADHCRSTYCLAVLYGATDELHPEAAELFHKVRALDPAFYSRAALGLALLAIDEGDVERARLELHRALTPATPLESERNAVAVAIRCLDLLREARGTRFSAAASGDSVVGQLARVLSLEHGEAPRGREFYRAAARKAASSRLIALALPLDDGHGSELSLLPVARPVRLNWRPRDINREFPVRAGSALTEFALDRIAESLVYAGVRSSTLGLGALALTVMAAWRVSIGGSLSAGLILGLACLFEVLDGRAAQLSGREIRVNVLLDYILDRVGDIALGVGFCVLFAGDTYSHKASAAAAILIGASLLSSYIRAEAGRMRLDAPRYCFERHHRLAVLVIGLLIGRPVEAVILACAFTIITCVVRATCAISDVGVNAVRDNEFRWTLMRTVERPGSNLRRGGTA